MLNQEMVAAAQAILLNTKRNPKFMKLKIAIIILISGILVSFGAIKKAHQANQTASNNEMQSTHDESGPAGGFVSEDR